MFVGHLHTHTEYSMLDGMAKIEDLILKAKSLGQKGIAITDHGSSSGLYSAYKLGKKHDFNVLLGQEFYMQYELEELKTGHLILIAKNEVGLSNIFKLQHLAYKNVYYKPRITIEMLKEYGNNLICTTACIANAVGQLILLDEEELAKLHIKELHDTFKEDLYIELQATTNPNVKKVNKALSNIIKEENYKCVATTDIHYVNKEDYPKHEILLAIQQQKKLDDKKRWKFEYNDYYLKSEEEMTNGLLDDVDIDIVNKCYEGISEVFEKCRGVEFKKGNYLPKFCNSKEEEDKLLKTETLRGWYSKLAERGEQTQKFYSEMLDELKVISETGYSGYFLIVQEYIKWAKENNILVGDGRGSACGSKVIYALDIADVNPDKYNLLFERFLSNGREPDIDVDFSDIDKVFKHLQERYGEDNIARVGAYTTFTCKSALRKVMSTYGFKQSEISKIIGLLPKELSFTLKDAINYSPEFKKWCKENNDIYETVKSFEGITEHSSTHAGGIIICNDLTYKLPTLTNSEDRSKLIVAMNKEELEELGHFKFDVLGLSALTTLANIIKHTGNIDWSKVDMNDENIYNMLSNGDVLGVFQLSEQRDKVLDMKPKSFLDLIALNALIRPGVCDWNDYMYARRVDNEIKENYMKETHGLIIYQEQYELLAKEYAGWEISYSDKHIRKNKNIKNDEELYSKWIEDVTNNGYERQFAIDLWDVIVKIVSGGYNFNKAHATSYAMLSFRTAYLKYYFPKEFYSAYLTQNNNNTEKLISAINEVKNKGIKLIKPDVNESTNEYIPTQEGILLPLTAIKSVGGSMIWAINNLRPIASFEDFMNRRVKKFCKANAIETLIKSDAFRNIDKDINTLLTIFNKDIKHLNTHEYEKEVFGYYITSSPFDEYKTLKPFDEYEENDIIITVIEISDISIRFDKRGNEMAFVTGINNTDIIRCIIFSSIWKNISIEEGNIVIAKGKKNKGSMLINSVERL